MRTSSWARVRGTAADCEDWCAALLSLSVRSGAWGPEGVQAAPICLSTLGRAKVRGMRGGAAPSVWGSRAGSIGGEPASRGPGLQRHLLLPGGAGIWERGCSRGRLGVCFKSQQGRYSNSSIRTASPSGCRNNAPRTGLGGPPLCGRLETQVEAASPLVDGWPWSPRLLTRTKGLLLGLQSLVRPKHLLSPPHRGICRDTDQSAKAQERIGLTDGLQKLCSDSVFKSEHLNVEIAILNKFRKERKVY